VHVGLMHWATGTYRDVDVDMNLNLNTTLDLDGSVELR